MAWSRGGETLLRAGLGEGVDQFVRYGLLIAVSFLAAGFAQVLIPSEWIQGALGRDSGMRGIALATAAGIATPAGPFVSLPIAATLMRGGAEPAAVVTYLTAWSLLARAPAGGVGGAASSERASRWCAMRSALRCRSWRAS